MADIDPTCPTPDRRTRRRSRGDGANPKDPRFIAAAGTIIDRCRARHGDRYDYSRAVYRGMHAKFEVVCPRPGHGSFWVTPGNHLSRGSNCPRCGNEHRGPARSTRDKFIAKAQERWGQDRYSYGEVEYINSKTPVT